MNALKVYSHSTAGLPATLLAVTDTTVFVGSVNFIMLTSSHIEFVFLLAY